MKQAAGRDALKRLHSGTGREAAGHGTGRDGFFAVPRSSGTETPKRNYWRELLGAKDVLNKIWSERRNRSKWIGIKERYSLFRFIQTKSPSIVELSSSRHWSLSDQISFVSRLNYSSVGIDQPSVFLFFHLLKLSDEHGKHFDVVDVPLKFIGCFEESLFSTKIRSKIRSSFFSSASDPTIIEEKSFLDRPPSSSFLRLGEYSSNGIQNHFSTWRQCEKYGRSRLVMQQSWRATNLSHTSSNGVPATEQQKSRTTSTSCDKSARSCPIVWSDEHLSISFGSRMSHLQFQCDFVIATSNSNEKTFDSFQSTIDCSQTKAVTIEMEFNCFPVELSSSLRQRQNQRQMFKRWKALPIVKRNFISSSNLAHFQWLIISQRWIHSMWSKIIFPLNLSLSLSPILRCTVDRIRKEFHQISIIRLKIISLPSLPLFHLHFFSNPSLDIPLPWTNHLDQRQILHRSDWSDPSSKWQATGSSKIQIWRSSLRFDHQVDHQLS